MKRAKKPKKTEKQKRFDNTYPYVRQANYTNLAVMVLCLRTFGWGKVRIGRFIARYCALIMEWTDNRNTARGLERDCKELTGYDIRDILGKVMDGDDSWKDDVEW